MNEKAPNELRSAAKKRIIISLIVILAVLALLFATVFVIDYFEASRKEEATAIQTISPDEFYPADWEEDIYTDKDYTDLISGEFIKYNGQNNEGIVGITTENLYSKDANVVFLVEMIYDIIEGDADSYNARFSTEYYRTNAPVEKFTKQKIYDVNITYAQSENASGKGTMYCIEYKILKNNGTFRNDILNGSKKQYITLVNDSGEIKINSLVTVNTQFK